MPAPTDLPDFATDATFAADGDSWSGDPTRVDPGAARLEEGFEPDLLPAPWLNHILGVHGDWINWLGVEERSVQTWHGIDKAVFGLDETDYTIVATADPFVGSAIRPLDANKHILLRLNLPHDAVLTEVRVIVETSATRVDPDWWIASIWTEHYNPTTGARTVEQQGASVADGGGAAGVKVIVLSEATLAIGTPIGPIDQGQALWLHMKVPATALASGDLFYGAYTTVTQTHPIQQG